MKMMANRKTIVQRVAGVTSVVAALALAGCNGGAGMSGGDTAATTNATVTNAPESAGTNKVDTSSQSGTNAATATSVTDTNAAAASTSSDTNAVSAAAGANTNADHSSGGT